MFQIRSRQYVEGNEVDLASLSALHRVLLITDGTLTEILQAYFLEEIQLVKLTEEIQISTKPCPQLQAEPGERLMVRTILLRGQQTGRTYVYAESLIALDRLDDNVRSRLVTTKIPIGRVWVENKLETFKEFIRAQRELADDNADHFGIEPDDVLLSRSYRVIWKGRPVMMITEKFPEDLVFGD